MVAAVFGDDHAEVRAHLIGPREKFDHLRRDAAEVAMS